MNENDLNYFRLAVKLEQQFSDQLIHHEVHFRPNLNSLSLISISQAKPELGVRCKQHSKWTSGILSSYITDINELPVPGRSTPEKSLQAWIIRKAQLNDGYLPFEKSIKFITSELAFQGSYGKKIVSDIIGYDTVNNQLVIIELKSQRLLRRLIEQVEDFERIFKDNFPFFKQLTQIHGFNKLKTEPRKAIVWPYARTSPLQELKAKGIAEFTYQENEVGGLRFNTHST